ncbi:MAG TPA: amidohydrolase family protein [Armatimonadota bacterium]|nr:amidohydrolase family protein [Armatimonadota bacterium]
MIIDIHTHAFPESLASRAVDELAKRSGLQPKTDGTCRGLVASTRRAEIELSVIAPIATKPGQASAINGWAIETNRNYSELTCFGTIHPDMEDWKEEIARLVNERFVGIKMHPDYQGFFVDEPRMFPIYEKLADAGMILLLHAGIDVGLPFPTHCTPERLANMMRHVPGLTIIAAHMGGYRQWDAVDRYLVGKNIYFDTACSLRSMGPRRMREMILLHGVDKILFGTDSPWEDQQEAIRDIRELNLSEEEQEAILGKNAWRLLNANL